MVQTTGTAFLVDLHRRAMADGILHVFEAAATAAVIGALMTIRMDGTGAAGTDAAAVVIYMGLCAAGWGGVTYGVLISARNACSFHVQLTLLHSGLLYLALEHEPAEMLPWLRQRGTAAGASVNPAGALSFTARMRALLRRYPSCSRALGCPPYPQWCQVASLAATLMLPGLFAIAVWMVWSVMARLFDGSAAAASAGLEPEAVLDPLHSVRVLFALCGALYLLRSTLGQAMRTGTMLALVAVLHGHVEPGRAVLAQR